MTSSRRPTRRRTTTTTSRTNRQRSTLGGVSGVIIVLIVLFVQFVLGIDVLNLNEHTATPPPASPMSSATPVPAPSAIPGGTPIASVPASLQPIPGGYDGGWFQVYFTTPIASNNPADFTGAPIEAALVKALDGAQQQIDAAMFEVNSAPVTQALIAAKGRGVNVRVVTDDRYGVERPDGTIGALQAADIPVVNDGSRSRLMHNKFFVIDRTYVWTGSTNITTNDIYKNNNNSLLIRSSRLAGFYGAEFEEMFSGKFGPTSPGETDLAVTMEDGTRIEVYFESEGDAGKRLAELIGAARSVRFMAFSFTDSLIWRDANGVDQSLMLLLRDRAASREINVMGIIEASQRSYTAPLYCASRSVVPDSLLEIRQDGNGNVLHHKVFIIDESIVVTGSFNFSSGASRQNDENMIVFFNPALAQVYLEEFGKRWAEAVAMPADAFQC